MIDTVASERNALFFGGKFSVGDSNYDCGVARIDGVPTAHGSEGAMTPTDVWYNATQKRAWATNFNSSICRSGFGHEGNDVGYGARMLSGVSLFMDAFRTNRHLDCLYACVSNDETNCRYSIAYIDNHLPLRQGSSKDASLSAEYLRINIDPKTNKTDGHWQMKEHSFYPSGKMDDCGFSTFDKIFRIDSGSTDAEQGQCLVFKTFHNGETEFEDDFETGFARTVFSPPEWDTSDEPRFFINNVTGNLEIRVDDQNTNNDAIRIVLPEQLEKKWLVQIPYNGTFINGTVDHNVFFSFSDATSQSPTSGTQDAISVAWRVSSTGEQRFVTHWLDSLTNGEIDDNPLFLGTDLGASMDDGCIEIARNYHQTTWNFYDSTSCTGTPLQTLLRTTASSITLDIDELDILKFLYSDLFSAGSGSIDIDIHSISVWKGINEKPTPNFAPDISVNINATGTGSSEMRVFVDVMDGAMNMGTTYTGGNPVTVLTSDMKENELRADLGSGSNHRLGIIEVDLPFEGEILIKPQYSSGSEDIFTVFVGLKDNSTDGTIILDINTVQVGSVINDFFDPTIRFHEQSNFANPSPIETELDTGYVSVNVTENIDQTDLEVYWKFEETSGILTTEDFVNIPDADSNNDSGMTKSNTGVIGNAWRTSDAGLPFVNITGTASDWDFIQSGSHSYNLWMQEPDPDNIDLGVLFNTHDPSVASNGGLIEILDSPANERLLYFIGKVPAGDILNEFVDQYWDTSCRPTCTSFQMVTITANETSGQVKFYKNGTLIETDSGFNEDPTQVPTAFTPQLFLRQDSFFALNKASFDEWSIWSRVLTPSEITDLFNSGNGLELPEVAVINAPPLPAPKNPITGGTVTSASSLDVDWIHDGINTTGYRIYRTSTEAPDTKVIYDTLGSEDFAEKINAVNVSVAHSGLSVVDDEIISELVILLMNDTGMPVTSDGLIRGAIFADATTSTTSNATLALSIFANGTSTVHTVDLPSGLTPFTFEFRRDGLVNLTSGFPTDIGFGVFRNTTFTGDVSVGLCTGGCAGAGSGRTFDTSVGGGTWLEIGATFDVPIRLTAINQSKLLSTAVPFINDTGSLDTNFTDTTTLLGSGHTYFYRVVPLNGDIEGETVVILNGTEGYIINQTLSDIATVVDAEISVGTLPVGLTNLEIYWKFDETSGGFKNSNITNIFPDGNSTTETGTFLKSETGIIGTAWKAPATGNTIKVLTEGTPSDYDFMVLGNSTFNMWVKDESCSTSGFAIQWTTFDNSIADGANTQSESCGTNDIMRARYFDSLSLNSVNEVSPNGYYESDANTFDMYTIVHDNTNDLISWFKNGVLLATNTTSGDDLSQVVTDNTPILWNSADFNVGYNNGTFDEFSFWSRALSTTDVTNLYNGGLGLELDKQVPVPPQTFNVTITDTVGASDGEVDTESEASMISTTYENSVSAEDVLSPSGGVFNGYIGNSWDILAGADIDVWGNDPIRIKSMWVNFGGSVTSGNLSAVIVTNMSEGGSADDLILFEESDTFDVSTMPNTYVLNPLLGESVVFNFTGESELTWSNSTFIGIKGTNVIGNDLSFEIWDFGSGSGEGICQLQNGTDVFSACVEGQNFGFELVAVALDTTDFETTGGIAPDKLVVHHTFDDEQLFDSALNNTLFKNAGTLGDDADISILGDSAHQDPTQTDFPTGVLGESIFLENADALMSIGFSDVQRADSFSFLTSNVTDTYSINFWVNATWSNQGTDFVPLLSNVNGNEDDGIVIGVDSSSNGLLTIFSDGVSVALEDTFTQTFNDDDWQMVTLIIEKSNVTSTALFCVDSVCETFDRDIGNTFTERQTVNNKLILGNHNTENFQSGLLAEPLEMLFDELCIWNDYKLTSSDRATLYNSGNGAVCGTVSALTGGANVTFIPAPIFNQSAIDTATVSDEVTVNKFIVDTTDLEVYWKFEETTGQMTNSPIANIFPSANSSSTQDIDKTNAGIIGNAWRSSDPTGIEAFVFIGGVTSEWDFTLIDDVSHNFWLKDEDCTTPANQNGIFSQTVLSGLGESYNVDCSGGTDAMFVDGGRGGAVQNANSFGSYYNAGENTFDMYTLVYNDTSPRTWKFYKNGVLDRSFAVGATGSGSTPERLPVLFNNGNLQNQGLNNATLDEYSIWDRILTGADIVNLYNNGQGLELENQVAIIPIINNTDTATVSDQVTVTKFLIDTTNLETYWKFDETSGGFKNSNITNIFPDGNSTTETGTFLKSETGIINTAWKSPATGNTVKVLTQGTPSDYNFFGTGNSTINMWVKDESCSTLGSIWGSIDIAIADGVRMFADDCETIGQATVQIQYFDSSGSDSHIAFAPVGFYDNRENEFHMSTVVHDNKPSGSILWYKDSILIDTDITTSDDLSGIATDQTPYFWNGDVLRPLNNATFDEWSFWSRALSSSEITTLFNNGLGLELENQVAVIPIINNTDTATVSDQVTVTKFIVDTTDLEAYWKFDETSGGFKNSNITNIFPDGNSTTETGTFNKTVTGIIGTAWKSPPTGDDARVTTEGTPSDYNFFLEGNSTINMWIKDESCAGTNNDHVLHTIYSSQRDGILLKVNCNPRSQSGLEITYINDILSEPTEQHRSLSASGSFEATNGTWNMYTMAHTNFEVSLGTTVDWYKDGVFLNSNMQSPVGNLSLGNPTVDRTPTFWNHPNNAFTPNNMTLDEVSFWSRLLTGDEISSLYNNGFGLELEDQVFISAPPPDQVTGVFGNYTLDNTEIRLTWTEPSSTEPILNYSIFRQGTGAFTFITNTTTINFTNNIDTLFPRIDTTIQNFNYTVSAISQDGAGENSTIFLVKFRPDKPTLLVPTRFSESQIDLSWVAPTGTIVGYKIDRVVNFTNTESFENFTNFQDINKEFDSKGWIAFQQGLNVDPVADVKNITRIDDFFATDGTQGLNIFDDNNRLGGTAQGGGTGAGFYEIDPENTAFSMEMKGIHAFGSGETAGTRFGSIWVLVEYNLNNGTDLDHVLLLATARDDITSSCVRDDPFPAYLFGYQECTTPAGGTQIRWTNGTELAVIESLADHFTSNGGQGSLALNQIDTVSRNVRTDFNTFFTNDDYDTDVASWDLIVGGTGLTSQLGNQKVNHWGFQAIIDEVTFTGGNPVPVWETLVNDTGSASTTFSDTSAPPSTESVIYRVSAYANPSGLGLGSEEKGFIIPAVAVPDQVTGLAVIQNMTNDAELDWDDASGADNYQVFRGSEIMWQLKEHNFHGSHLPSFETQSDYGVSANNTLIVGTGNSIVLHSQTPLSNGHAFIYKSFQKSFVEGKDLVAEIQSYCSTGDSCVNLRISLSVTDGSWEGNEATVFPDDASRVPLGKGNLGSISSSSPTAPSAGITNITLSASAINFTDTLSEVTIYLLQPDGSVGADAQTEIFRIIIGNSTTGQTIFNFSSNPTVNYTALLAPPDANSNQAGSATFGEPVTLIGSPTLSEFIDSTISPITNVLNYTVRGNSTGGFGLNSTIVQFGLIQPIADLNATALNSTAIILNWNLAQTVHPNDPLTGVRIQRANETGIEDTIWQFREVKWSGGSSTTIVHSVSSSSANMAEAITVKVGTGMIFKNFTNAFLNNSRIIVDWQGGGDTGFTGTTANLQVYNHAYNRDNFSEIPTPSTAPPNQALHTEKVTVARPYIGNPQAFARTFDSVDWINNATTDGFSTVIVNLRDANTSIRPSVLLFSVNITDITTNETKAFYPFGSSFGTTITQETSPEQDQYGFYNVTGATVDGLQFVTIATVDELDTSFTDTGLNATTTYSYRLKGVSAVSTGAFDIIANATTASGAQVFNQTEIDIVTVIDNTDVTTGKSNSDTATTSDQQVLTSPPFPITTLSASTVGNTCELSWSAPPNGNSPIIKYQIFRAVSSGAFSLLLNQTFVNHTDTGLINNVLYEYNVTSINAFGDSEPSNIEDCMPIVSTVPNAPALTDVNEEPNGDVTIDWIASTEGSPTGYKIERKVGGGGFLVLVANTGTSDVTFTDTTTSPATQFTYRISGINAFGTGAPSNEGSITTASPPNAPLLSGAQNGDQIDISWSIPASANPINGYKIDRRINLGAFTTLIANTSSTLTTFSDSNVTKPDIFGYRVRALSSAGEGTVSNIIDITFGSHIVVEVREQDGSGFKGGGIVTGQNSTFNLEIGLDVSSNAVFDNLAVGNFNFTFRDADNFILNKTFNFPAPAGNDTSTLTVNALVFDVDCPANGLGTDIRIKVNYTDQKDITEFPSTPVCDSSDQVSWSTRWQGSAVNDTSTMIADFISTVFQANAEQFLASADIINTTFNDPLNKITSETYVVNMTDVTINFNLFLGRAPQTGGGGGGSSGSTPTPQVTIPDPDVVFADRLTGLSILSRTHQFAQAGDVIEGTITVNWEGEDNLNVKRIDIVGSDLDVRFDLPPFPLDQRIEGIGEFAKSSAEIPYIIVLPPTECNVELGLTQNCFDPILHTLPVEFIFGLGDQDYVASTEIFVDGRPIPIDIVQLQIILLFGVLIASAVFGNFIRNKFKKSKSRSKTTKKKFKKKFDSS